MGDLKHRLSTLWDSGAPETSTVYSVGFWGTWNIDCLLCGILGHLEHRLSTLWDSGAPETSTVYSVGFWGT